MHFLDTMRFSRYGYPYELSVWLLPLPTTLLLSHPQPSSDVSQDLVTPFFTFEVHVLPALVGALQFDCISPRHTDACATQCVVAEPSRLVVFVK